MNTHLSKVFREPGSTDRGGLHLHSLYQKLIVLLSKSVHVWLWGVCIFSHNLVPGGMKNFIHAGDVRCRLACVWVQEHNQRGLVFILYPLINLLWPVQPGLVHFGFLFINARPLFIAGIS